MVYREIIQRVQNYSGYSLEESKDALDCLVETLAVRLSDDARRDFASRLPVPASDIALAVWSSEENSSKDVLQQFMENMHLDEPRARRQLKAAWRALKDAVGRQELDFIRAQLAKPNLAFLT